VDRAAYLSLQNVSKSYDGKIRAVDGIDLDINRGEFVTFLGPSGSGKTTTLMMIAGFEDPDDGTIVLDGKNLAQTRPYDRNIGMVFQNYALFPHMTVARNVGFPLRMRRTRKEEVKRRVDEVLKLVALADCSERYPRELSGGQQQRVAVARGLVFVAEGSNKSVLRWISTIIHVADSWASSLATATFSGDVFLPIGPDG
jgi:putative spermidine/putrescine transport system ATP-binding protein